jgi:polyphosphate kinase
MHRNLDRRVEVLASITNPTHIAEISDLFVIAFDPGTAAWHLDSNGHWTQVTTDDQGKPLLDMQEYLINSKSRRRAK